MKHILTAVVFAFTITLAQSDSNIASTASDSVVSIYVEYPQMNAYGSPAQAFGTGVVLSDDGYIITNNHVISHANNVVVQTNGGHRAYAQVVASAPDFDIAIVKIDPASREPLRPIQFAKTQNISVGDQVAAVGNAFGFDQTYTQGVVSKVDRNISLGSRVQSFTQVDCAVNPGNSGGPLLNKQGELIGIVTGIYGPKLQTSFNIGIALAIPVDVVQPVVNQLLKNGSATPGWLGIASQKLTPELESAFAKNHIAHGVLVSEVLPGSPAAKAKLKPTDIITQINHIPVQSPHHLSSLVTALGSNATLDINYIRDDQPSSLRLKTGHPGNYSPPSTHGPYGFSMTEQAHAQLGGATHRGVYINDIAPQSPAALNGLTIGDKVVSINNKKLTKLEDVSAHHANESPQIMEIERNQRTFFVSL
ncbi:trypsin-like peptidase domain-containing protein [Candidatus Comchoanobacter bicostacola]|uniref:Trypsin-like peptidase domain-containing protein n=1 Tax=Candidatus Comchoanobacter bicostacola TaxID=2919598 RepID=A0ABY5DHU0_9GAMM|nr:trypsin-like peptidase domain-containing protein [Candidatus Comchoanobacter bicostacola]UTC24228.1 trypsin-like peptidase domain-containing protein [Candidatus Comchoanobacter bicostacola]